MTNQENGPGETDNRSGENGTVLNGSNTDSGAWLAGLSEDNRSVAENKKWEGPNSVIEAYRNLETHASKALVLPAADASEEEFNKFYSRVGRPEKPEGYEFKLPDGLPENMPYDDTLATNLKNWAHENGLSPRQAQGIHDAYISEFAGQYEAAVKDTEAKVNGSHEALVSEWGEKDTVKYNRNVELADRAIRQTGGEELRNELKRLGALTDAGEVASAPIALMLAQVGEAMFFEDAVFNAPNSHKNPWSDKDHNLTEQGKILKSDPQRAKALIKEAGQDPSLYGLG